MKYQMLLTIVAIVAAIPSIDSQKRTPILTLLRNLGSLGTMTGCLHSYFTERKHLQTVCFSKALYEYKKAITDGTTCSDCEEGKKYPNFKKFAEDFSTCIMEEGRFLNDDGTIDVKHLNEPLNLEGNPDDNKIHHEILTLCTKKALDVGQNPTDVMINLLHCKTGKVIEVCNERGQRSGMAWTLLHALISYGVENHECDNVQLSKEISEARNKCLVEANTHGPSDFFDRILPMLEKLGRSLRQTFKGVYGEFQQIPEMKCVHSSDENIGLIRNGKLDAEAVRSQLVGLDGWKNQEVAQKLGNAAYNCINSCNDEPPFISFIRAKECFLPPLIKECGLHNNLTWHFVLPRASHDWIESIKRTLGESYHNSKLKAMIMKAQTS